MEIHGLTDIAIDLPIEVIERERVKWEREQERRLRYEKNSGRTRHDLNESRPNGHKRDIHYKDYPFIMWDGEAPSDTGYSLFGSSEGHEICHPCLGTEECLQLLLEAKEEFPQSIFVWFGGRYDWDEILRQDMPLRALARLKSGSTVHWRGYRLTECEGKVYTLSSHGVSVTLYEIHSWFHTPYVVALEDYGIGTARERKQILDGKGDRPDFLWKDIKEIRKYMRLELKLGPPLMNKIREICLNAGFNPRAWYGPSALARELLTKNKIRKSMAICPKPVNDAACMAFAGGRFEDFRGGYIKRKNWTYDKNSAYMHAALELPNLSRGTWRRTKGDFEPGKFGVYHIRYRDRNPFDPMRPYPLFRRLRNGNVCWPRRVEGWYWAPEAELVADDNAAVFLEGWIFDEDDPRDRPFKFVREIYRRRLLLQALAPDNPSRVAEIALKWALAAIYGQLARAIGWDQKNKLPPPTHQIEWAGYILSHCRAAMHRLAVFAGQDLASIDTDSVTMFKPCDILPMGKELGEWKVSVADEGVFFQNGVFFTRENGEWTKGKARGVEKRPKNPGITPELLIEAIDKDLDVQLKPRRKYITVKMALNGMYDEIGKWVDHPGNTLSFGGGGKRYHNRKLCSRLCSGEVHSFIPAPVGLDDPDDVLSVQHHLPWKDSPEDMPEDKHIDTMWFPEECFLEEGWIARLVEKYPQKVRRTCT